MAKRITNRPVATPPPVTATAQPAPAAAAPGADGWRWAPWLVALLAALVYANTLTADFTLDDLTIIKENERIASLKNLRAFFQLDYWGGASEEHADKASLYRPLTVITYALNYAAHGLRPAGYHHVNVVLHALVSGLLCLLVRRLFGAPPMALAAGLLFAVHPIHTETVANVVGRAEVLALLGTLTAGLAYERAREAAAAGSRKTWGWMALSLAGFLAGMFSKETGVVAPALILLWEALLPARRWLLKRDPRAFLLFGAYAMALGFYLWMRSRAVHATNLHLGWAGATGIERVLTALRVGLEYMGLLLAPVRLSADYWVTDVPLARSLLQPGVLLALLALGAAGAAFFLAARRQPAISWGLGAFALAWFPVSNLAFPIGLMKAERILYTPSAGFLVALAACLPPLCRRARSPALPWGVLGLVVALFAARTWARNADWHDNYALAVATLNTSPHSPPFHTILANWHRDRRENEPRRQHLLQALEQMPREPCYLFNLGNFWLDEKKYDEAIACYQQALEVNPNYISALNNLGRACHESRRYPEAAAAFQRVVALRPNAFTGYINLVTACQMLNQPAAALPVAEEASRRFPNEAGVFWVLCGVYKSLGRTNEAKRAFNRALQLDPGITTRKDLKTRR